MNIGKCIFKIVLSPCVCPRREKITSHDVHVCTRMCEAFNIYNIHENIQIKYPHTKIEIGMYGIEKAFPELA